jgi:hypothetical protein
MARCFGIGETEGFCLGTVKRHFFGQREGLNHEPSLCPKKYLRTLPTVYTAFGQREGSWFKKWHCFGHQKAMERGTEHCLLKKRGSWLEYLAGSTVIAQGLGFRCVALVKLPGPASTCVWFMTCNRGTQSNRKGSKGWNVQSGVAQSKDWKGGECATHGGQSSPSNWDVQHTGASAGGLGLNVRSGWDVQHVGVTAGRRLGGATQSSISRRFASRRAGSVIQAFVHDTLLNPGGSIRSPVHQKDSMI